MKQEVVDLVKTINKQFGKGTIEVAASHKGTQWKRLQSNILTFDIITGGGVPKNNIVTLFGPYSSGKSTLALKMIASEQKRGGTPAYIYSEGTIDETHLIACGVDLNNLILVVKNNSEDVIDVVQTLTLSKQIPLIVVDSLQGLVPDMVLERSAHQRTMGVEAFMNGQLIKKFLAATSLKAEEEPWCSLVLIAHGTEVFGSTSKKIEVRGGNAVKFFSVIIVEVKKGQPINSKGQLIEWGSKDKKVGHEIKMSIYKNKTFPPFKIGVTHYITGDTDIGLKRGNIDPIFEIVRNGILYGMFEQKGAWIYYGDSKWNGINAFMKYLRDSNSVDLYKEIYKKGLLKESSITDTVDHLEEVKEEVVEVESRVIKEEVINPLNGPAIPPVNFLEK